MEVSCSNALDSTKCPICGNSTNITQHRHYGSVETCKPCSSFFRRSILENKTYRCKNSDQCALGKGRYKHGCRFCRFQRCLRAGMTMDAVLQSRNGLFMSDIGEQNLLERLIQCRRSNFSSRYKAIIDLCDKPSSSQSQSHVMMTPRLYEIGFAAEVKVFRQFLYKSNIIDAELRGTEFEIKLFEKFGMTWMAMEMMFNTVRFAGFLHSRSYYVDGNFMTESYDEIEKFMKGFNYYDPFVVSRCGLRLMKAMVEKTRRMYEARIDEADMSALLFILLYKSAELLPNETRFRTELGKLFHNLKGYYESNYEDVALRMGNIVLFIDMIMAVSKIKEELKVLADINTFRPAKGPISQSNQIN